MFQAYALRCLVNGKLYIGVTSRSLTRRWANHVYDAGHRARMAISRAIAKHGAENFRIEAVCSARSWEDICAVEAILIRQYGTRAPHGYNLSDGGDGAFGVKKTAESIERSAAKHRGKPCHENTRSAASVTHLGKPKSEQHRAKIAAARTGTTRSEATKEKIRAYWAKRRAAGEFKTPEAYAHRKLPLSRYIGATYRPMTEAA